MKTFKIIIAFLLIIFSFNIGISQRIISGKVLTFDKEIVPFATIIISDSTINKILQTGFSDEKGMFKISLRDDIVQKKKNIYIRAKIFNNESSKYLVSEDTLTILMSNTTTLSEVVVRLKESTLSREADRFIYTPNPNLKTGATSLDVLKIAPLIDYDIKNDVFSIINKENTLVMINRKRTVFPKEMLISFLKSTPATNIINIEIITNPGSEFSANTTGGVININMKKNIDEGFLGNIVLSNEQSILNTAILNGGVNYRRRKIGIRFSLFLNNSFNYKTYNNFIDKISGDLEETNNLFERRYIVIGGGFGLDYDINQKNTLGINGFVSTVNGDSNQNSKTSYNRRAGTLIDSTYSSPIDGRDNYLYNFGNIFFEHKFDNQGNKKITINFDYNQFKKENLDIGSFENISIAKAVKSTYKNDFSQDFFNNSTNIDWSSQTSEKNKINIGTQFSNTNINSSLDYFNYNSSISDFKINNNLSSRFKYFENYLALYVTSTKVFNSKLNGSFGLRLEATNYSSENIASKSKIDSNYVKLFPNISIAYTINKNETISLALSERIKRPSFELLLPGRSYLNPTFFSENNPFLTPVSIYTIELMYSLKNRYFFTIGDSYFRNQYAQFIIPISENTDLIQKKTYINYGNTNNLYLQFYTKQSLFDDIWELNCSTALNYSTYQNKSDYLETKQLSNFNYNVSINNNIYISNKNKIVGFCILRYFSPIRDLLYERENVLFKTDIGLRKTIKNYNFTLYLSDIFNTYNETFTNYNPNKTLITNRIIQNNYTRSISLNINYFFGNNKLKTIKNKKIANDELKNRIN